MSRRSVTNAFTRGQGNPARRLASALAPMRAALDPAPFGFALRLSPMFASDAAAALPAADAAMLEDAAVLGEVPAVLAPDALNLLALSGRSLHLGDFARRLGIETAGQWMHGGPPWQPREGASAVAVGDAALRQLLSLLPPGGLSVVRVHGPIEPRDAHAILAAIERGASPLDAELRAVAAMQIVPEHVVSMHARRREQTIALVAENFRHYLAALCDRPALDFSAPAVPQLWPLMEQGGITVRPIETEVFSTFIDIGVCMTAEEPSQPAECSLVYDVPSDTWHVE